MRIEIPETPISVSIKVLVEGSAQGLFVKDRKTKKWRKLSDYFNEGKSDWDGARKIINPGSKRAHIPSEHAQKFLACLEGAWPNNSINSDLCTQRTLCGPRKLDLQHKPHCFNGSVMLALVDIRFLGRRM